MRQHKYKNETSLVNSERTYLQQRRHASRRRAEQLHDERPAAPQQAQRGHALAQDEPRHLGLLAPRASGRLEAAIGHHQVQGPGATRQAAAAAAAAVVAAVAAAVSDATVAVAALRAHRGHETAKVLLAIHAAAAVFAPL